MLPHVNAQLRKRGLYYPEKYLKSIAEKCECDSAVVLDKLSCPVSHTGNDFSNGDLILLIVRNKFPVTIMFRRSWNQPLTEKALNVRKIIWIKEC